MSERIGVIRRVLLPADDLSLEFERAGYYGLGDDIKLGLSLLYGIGPNQPRLITVDDAGRLLLGNPSGPIGEVRIIGAQAGFFAGVRQPNADGAGVANVDLNVASDLYAMSGAGWDRVRSSSAANLAAQSGIGGVITSPPGMWTASAVPAVGSLATATKAAAAAGVRHICTGLIVTFGAIAAPVATVMQWVLRDGLTGVGSILAVGQVAIPAAVFQGQPIMLSGLAIPGTAATAMTLEFTAALANLAEAVTLLGFDS